MSYGRQNQPGHRPPFQPPTGGPGMGPNGSRQGGGFRPAPAQGGLRRETWRPSAASPERAPQRNGPGPSGYRSNGPLPPVYPDPPATQAQYEPYTSQPFNHYPRQGHTQPSSFQQQPRYPDPAPSQSSEPYYNERFSQPYPQHSGQRSPPRAAPNSRDPQAFIHPSRRVRPPVQASTSAPQPDRGNGNGYGDRHGKGKGRDDSFPEKGSRDRSRDRNRRHRDDAPKTRGRSRSRESHSSSPVRKDRRHRTDASPRDHERSRSPTRHKRRTSASRSRSPKRAKRRDSPSRSRSRSRSMSPARRKRKNHKRRASPSYDQYEQGRGRSPERETASRHLPDGRKRSRSPSESKSSSTRREAREARRESISQVDTAPESIKRNFQVAQTSAGSWVSAPTSEVGPIPGFVITTGPVAPPPAPVPAVSVVYPVAPPAIATPAPSVMPAATAAAPEPKPVTPAPLLAPAPTGPVRITLKPPNGRHAVHPSRVVALDTEDAFERLAKPHPPPVSTAVLLPSPAPAATAAPRPPPPKGPSPPPAIRALTPPPPSAALEAASNAQLELNRVQHGWDLHLEDVAPYIQSAFFDWESQGLPMSQVEGFLGHFLRREPKAVELRLVHELHEHYMRYIEAKIRLDALVPPPSPPKPVSQAGEATVPAPLPASAAADLTASIPSPKRETKPTPHTLSTADTPSSTTVASPADPAVASAPPGRAPDETYQRLAQVGEGTYGKVYKAKHVHTGVHVALKRIRMEGEKDGFPVTAMREIKLLQSLEHPNIIRLYEMMISKGSVYMVMQYMDHDLTGLLAQPNLTFSPAHLKSLNYQMLAALAYLHDRGILHRDMKGSNILLNAAGELKLADFGLARLYNRRKRNDYTNRVITLWYRGPELLLGETVYGPEVDMWSAGCIMLELFTTRPIFQGNDEIHQLQVIYNVCGTPNEEAWPRLKELPWYELVKPNVEMPNRFRDSFAKWLSPAALDLAEGLLRYDPAQRLSAAAALEMEYFTSEEPAMERPAKLLEGRGEHHELTAKQDRARRRASKQ